jgi:2-(1,2-epoxy-1,2-dihydrophenyl)acetyl-CoA isomerase
MGLSLLGERLKADVAEEWGLIWKSVPDADFESTVDGLASQLAAGPSLAYAQTKFALNGSLNRTLEQQLDVERDGMRLLGKSRDYREGIEAFLDKRGCTRRPRSTAQHSTW